LNDGVLLADARVLGRKIDDGEVSANQPATPSAQFDRVDDVWALEDKQLP
jgi:hypothetical protein